MKREHYQLVIASVWVVTVLLAALAAGVTSLSGFGVVAVVGLVPPLVMQLTWRDPPETMSEIIRHARR